MRTLWFTMLLTTVACSGPTAPEAATTFTEVGPILERRCVTCHQSGGIGSFTLDSYESAQPWAEAVATAASARTMPPFLVQGDGTCGEFRHNQWLSDDEIATLEAWADDGAPVGDDYVVTPPTLPTLSGSPVEIQTPDFTPEIVGGDRAEFDEYRCFAIELPSTERAFLTGYDVIPGNAAMVHHVIGMPVDLSATSQDGTRTNAEVIAAKGDPEREGWPCFSGAGPDVGPAPEIMIWAPGQGAVEYPAGMGVRIPSGSAMVVQVHYNLVDPALRGQSDQTTIQLKLTPDVDREVLPLLPDGFLDGDASMTEIPAGQAKATVEWEVPVSVIGNLPLDFDLVGFFPHMHERGTRMWVDFERGAGGEDCVARVPSWDFDWQRIYFYDTPIRFSTADTLKVRCEYDTSADTEPTIPGWGTQNEMCLAGVYIALAP